MILLAVSVLRHADDGSVKSINHLFILCFGLDERVHRLEVLVVVVVSHLNVIDPGDRCKQEDSYDQQSDVIAFKPSLYLFN